MTEDLDPLRKRLLYRACHRGTKEMDMVLGGFAEAHLAGYDADALRRFEAVLEESDADFLGWVTGQTPVPAADGTGLIAAVVAFARKGLTS